MLPLESPEWSLLHHAHGPATDTPDELRKLAADPRPKANAQAQPWERLWSSLCHQGDVYTASYAAVPHIVEVARSTEGPIDFGFLQLPACVEIARCKGQGPAIPASLAKAYHGAIAGLTECISRHLKDEWDTDTALVAAAALVVAKGQIRLGDALMNLDRDTITKIVNGEL